MINQIVPRFHGAWRLVSPVSDGILYYHPGGQMSVQTAPRRDRPRAGTKPTPAEALAAIDGYVGYFGTWSIDESVATVTHHQLATVQPGPRTDLVRTYEFVSDTRLILRPVGATGEIVWERILS